MVWVAVPVATTLLVASTTLRDHRDRLGRCAVVAHPGAGVDRALVALTAGW